MALIKCPKCGKPVSDRAHKCPHCGLDVARHLAQSREPERPQEQLPRAVKPAESQAPEGNSSKTTEIVILSLFAVIIVVFAVLFFTRTSSDQAAAATDTACVIEETVPPAEPKRLQTQRYTFSKKTSDTYSVDYSIDYPTGGEFMLVRNVREWINEYLGGMYSGDLNDGQAVVNYYGNKIYKEYGEPSEQIQSIKLIAQTDTYVTYEIDYYDWTGGAHGIDGEFGVTFRSDDGRKFGWDMFEDKYRIQPVLKEQLKKHFNCSDAELEGRLESHGALPERDPWLTHEGVVFGYYTYEIGSGFEGPQIVTVPYYKSKRYLTSTAAKLIAE